MQLQLRENTYAVCISHTRNRKLTNDIMLRIIEIDTRLTVLQCSLFFFRLLCIFSSFVDAFVRYSNLPDIVLVKMRRPFYRDRVFWLCYCNMYCCQFFFCSYKYILLWVNIAIVLRWNCCTFHISNCLLNNKCTITFWTATPHYSNYITYIRGVLGNVT